MKFSLSIVNHDDRNGSASLRVCSFFWETEEALHSYSAASVRSDAELDMGPFFLTQSDPIQSGCSQLASNPI